METRDHDKTIKSTSVAELELWSDVASKSGELENKIQEKRIRWWESVMENDKLKNKIESLHQKINNMNRHLNQKAHRIALLELELGKVKERESLTNQAGCSKTLPEEQHCLAKDLSSTAEELSRIKNELLTKSDEVSVLLNADLINKENNNESTSKELQKKCKLQ